MVGVVVAVHAVAADGVNVGDIHGDPFSDDLNVMAVVLVVGRVCLRHPHDVAAFDRAVAYESEQLQFTGGERDQLVVELRPHVVALEDEELQTKTGPSFLDKVGRPGAIVLDPADLDTRVMDVDPVVGKAELGGDDERDGEVIAVAQIVGRFNDLGRRWRIHAQHEG